jgi:hypothetical protein
MQGALENVFSVERVKENMTTALSTLIIWLRQQSVDKVYSAHRALLGVHKLQPIPVITTYISIATYIGRMRWLSTAVSLSPSS